MGVKDGATAFSEETLRIEISGPNLPSLTLVDLPGYYHSKTTDQSREGIAVVSRLVERYMKQRNSIILAVVSAKTEIAGQVVLDESSKHDPSRERTMGIITKPDTLTPGSADETKYVQLAKNQESALVFKHGWHVLRNRDSIDNDEQSDGASRTSDTERDQREAEFLSSGVWASLSPNNKGIDSLRQKLSKMLTRHIHQSLPGVIEDIQGQMDTRRQALQRLGKPRTSTAQIRSYLHSIADRFRDLTRAAVKGTYDDRFFCDNASGPDRTQSDARKLRAVVRNLNQAFDTIISSKGARREVFWDSLGMPPQPNSTGPKSLNKWMELYKVDDPIPVTIHELKGELDIKAANSRGTQFPGSPDDRLALELFRDLSQRWGDIAEAHVVLVTNAAKAFVELVLQYVVGSDDSTRDAVLRECVDPFFERQFNALQGKLKELLHHYREGDALCMEDEFIRRLTYRTKVRVADEVKKIRGGLSFKPVDEKTDEQIVQAVLDAPGVRVSEFGHERVVDMMTAYYKVCSSSLISGRRLF
jgi:hypothetical protein